MNKEPGYVYILTRSTSGRLHTCKNPSLSRGLGKDWQEFCIVFIGIFV